MNLLLDTSALIWWLEGHHRIAGRPRTLIADSANTVFVSAASTWELAIKLSIGRIAMRPELLDWFPQVLKEQRFVPLSISIAHTLRIETLPRHHDDPFDRLLIAQALLEGCWLVTGDRVFAAYEVPLVLC